MAWRILTVPEIISIWDRILPQVRYACLASAEKYTPEYFLQILTEDHALLWADENIDNFILCDAIQFPKKKFARVVMGMGKDLKTDDTFIATFETWARENDFQGVLTEVREGLVALFRKEGWRKTHVLMEKEF